MTNCMNRAILIGNLGADPELKILQGGQAVLQFSLATSETWIDKQSNEKREKTEWHRVVMWGKRAEALAKILEKGKTVWVEGRIQTRSWEDKEGNKRYSTEINASDLGLLGGGKGDRGGQHEQSGQRRAPSAAAPAQHDQGGGWDGDPGYESGGPGVDDIPF